MSKPKTLLHVVMLDTHRTRISIIHENEHIPYRRRLVTIELTDDQATKLLPQKVGSECGKPVFEEIGQVWIEHPGETQS